VAQRERLLQATRLAYASGARTVSAVVALAGVGRDSFYESFDDFEHALRVAARRSTAHLARVLRAAAATATGPRHGESATLAIPPSDSRAAHEAARASPRLSSVCLAWFRFASEEPLQMQCALTSPDAAREFVDALLEPSAGVPDELAEVATKELLLTACATEIALAVSTAELERSGVTSNSRAVGVKSRKDVGARPQMGRVAMSLAEGTHVLTNAVLKILR
jgi:AcrR family transcriptional regulator